MQELHEVKNGDLSGMLKGWSTQSVTLKSSIFLVFLKSFLASRLTNVDKLWRYPSFCWRLPGLAGRSLQDDDGGTLCRSKRQPGCLKADILLAEGCIRYYAVR